MHCCSLFWETWVSWYQKQLRYFSGAAEVTELSAVPVQSLLQSFLPANQQCQSTKGVQSRTV